MKSFCIFQHDFYEHFFFCRTWEFKIVDFGLDFRVHDSDTSCAEQEQHMWLTKGARNRVLTYMFTLLVHVLSCRHFSVSAMFASLPMPPTFDRIRGCSSLVCCCFHATTLPACLPIRRIYLCSRCATKESRKPRRTSENEQKMNDLLC